MNPQLLEFLTESLYSTDYSKDQKRNTNIKYSDIIDGNECLIIKDKSLSSKFMESYTYLFQQYQDFKEMNKTLKLKLKDCPSNKDWEYISCKYQDVLVQIENIKKESINKINKERVINFEQMKGHVSDTEPYKEIKSQYYDYQNKYNKLYGGHIILEEKYSNIYDDHRELLLDMALEKSKDKQVIVKKSSSDDAKKIKNLEKQVKVLKKTLKLEQEKSILLLETHSSEEEEDDLS